MSAPTIELGEPARYTPWAKGVYDVAPGLRPFGFDFGNGELDGKLFQFDSWFSRFRESKQAALAERPEKYRLRHDLSPDVEAAAVSLIREKLVHEWPSFFEPDGDGLRCALTGETTPSSLDGLLLQVQEDMAIVSTNEEGRDWVSYLNVCSPSHWAAGHNIGKSFFGTHTKVPGFERVNAVAPAMVQSMIRKGPFVRFVWGIESDDRLNHHPEPPPGEDPARWDGRRFSEALWVRAERQVIWGIPEVDAALFVIRVSLLPGSVVADSPELSRALSSALESMSPETRAYKGVTDGWQKWLPYSR